MDQKLIDDFFNDFVDTEKVNLIKSTLGTIKKIDSIDFFEPNEQFKAYLEYKKKFDDSNSALQEIKKRAENKEIKAIHQLSISGSLLHKMINSALNSWISLGYKNEVEKIINN
ncbi:hypothetical protein FIA58_007340 [Flavobacterium jejuense]|uniref:Uncharacterized protein n=1 Tax=Flavobacterium jejuense TaxID=1544455 RepID=A0ABX0INV2_9FLAO|nr:hypothetical protein [Flavobacterium jejuense]NHN25487.1 hypothetical protein [Flavobacterium jejuense]